jgi:hypothetical protein
MTKNELKQLILEVIDEAAGSRLYKYIFITDAYGNVKEKFNNLTIEKMEMLLPSAYICLTQYATDISGGLRIWTIENRKTGHELSNALLMCTKDDAVAKQIEMGEVNPADRDKNFEMVAI